MPVDILAGVDGSLPRLSSQPQSFTSGNERIRIQAGLTAFQIVPDQFERMLSFAKYVSVDPLWWNAIQKTITMRNITSSAIMRRDSGTLASSLDSD